MDIKPKVGVFLFTAGWFREVGLQGKSSNLSDEVDEIASTININLSEFAQTSFKGVIFSEESARNAALEAKVFGIDTMIVSPLMWSEDILLKTILKELPGIPVIFCNFLPYENFEKFMSFDKMLKGSGTVGALQMSGFLKREEFLYAPVFGYYKDKNVYKELKRHINAISVSKSLKALKVGVLPYRCDQMTVTYVDEFNLHKLYGIELCYIELQKVKDAAQSFSNEDISSFKSLLYSKGFEIEVDERNLTEAIKYSLALEKIIKKNGLKAMAINDVIEEMHDCFGLRPCLANPRLSDYGINIAMEADIAASVAMHMLDQYLKCAPFYTEILCADIKNNSLIMGHMGYYDCINSDPAYPVKIISDPEYKTTDRFTGACMYYKYKPGPVTIINSIYDGSKLRWTAAEGNSLEGPPILEGDPHVHFSLKKPINLFFKEVLGIGVSQHWIVVNGHVADEVELLCNWNKIEYIKLS